MTDRSAMPLSRGEGEELDVELVQTALQEFLQELKEAQRDRVYLNFFQKVGFVFYVCFFKCLNFSRIFATNKHFCFRMKPRLRLLV